MSVIMCDHDILPRLFTRDDIENALQWVCTLRKDYSSNSDIWRLRRDWDHIKDDGKGEATIRTLRFIHTS